MDRPPQELGAQEHRKSPHRWSWLIWLLVGLLVAAKVLWATTAYYEWIPLTLAIVTLVVVRLILSQPRLDDRAREDSKSGRKGRDE